MAGQLTKRAIEASLKRLLLEKPFNKITVADIAEDCGISRMTFYYHFQDIYDLVEWACEEDAARAIAGNRTAGTWRTGLLNTFREAAANKAFIDNVYRHMSREQIDRFLVPVVRELIMDVVEERAAGRTVARRDLDFVAGFFAHAFAGVMIDWVREGMSEDPQQIVDRVGTLMEGQIELALDRFEERRPRL